MRKFEYNKILVISVEDVYPWDFPDYSDAFISAAEYDGELMTDDELDELNEDYELVYDLIWEYLR